MSSATSPALNVARAYHQAWTSHDFATAGHYLADDLQVDVPINRYDTKQDFLGAVAGFGQMVTRVDVLAEFGNDDDALVLYDLLLPQMGLLRVAEHFVIEDGRIKQIRQIHDTAALRAAGFVKSAA